MGSRLSHGVLTLASGGSKYSHPGLSSEASGELKECAWPVHLGIWGSKYSHPGLSSEACGESKECHLGCALGHLGNTNTLTPGVHLGIWE